MRIAVLAALMGLSLLSSPSCGNVTDSNPLAGTIWDAQVNTTDVLVVAFDSDTLYQEGTAFSLTGGQIGVDIEKGTYSFHDNQLTTVPTSASCPTHSHPTGVSTFAINGSTLTLTSSQGALVLTKTPTNMTSGGAVVFGCSEGNSFTAHAIVPL